MAEAVKIVCGVIIGGWIGILIFLVFFVLPVRFVLFLMDEWRYRPVRRRK